MLMEFAKDEIKMCIPISPIGEVEMTAISFLARGISNCPMASWNVKFPIGKNEKKDDFKFP